MCHGVYAVWLFSKKACAAAQANVRAPSVGIRLLCSAALVGQQQQQQPSFWATGRCTGLHMALDTRRPLGQRTSFAGRLRRSVGAAGPEEAQLLQVDWLALWRMLSFLRSLALPRLHKQSCVCGHRHVLTAAQRHVLYVRMKPRRT